LRSGNNAKSCPDDHYDKTGTQYTTAEDSNFNSVCCTAKPTSSCSTLKAGANGKTCPDTHTDTSGFSPGKWAAATDATFNANCCTAKPDDTKCAHVTKPNGNCGSGKFHDTAKNTAGATTATYVANCCTAKKTCQNFKDHVLTTQNANGADMMKVHLGLLLAAGLVVFGN
jgi:hypothetical protein